MNKIETNRQKRLVLACEVMERELRQFENDRIDFRFFDYGLHRTPESMGQVLQKEIDRIAAEDYGAIVLGYGLCSNGIVGIVSRKQPSIVPRIHDCISLFLGSSEAYRFQAEKFPGTYYLTPGWIDKGETPLSKYESYSRSYDPQTALWILQEEMKHYTRLALIDTQVTSMKPYQARAREDAAILKLDYEEMEGSSALFQELLCGPIDGKFLIIERGHPISQEVFLDP